MLHNLFKDKAEAFTRLLKIMDDLREKCPWDRKQTIHSLRSLTIEETYELADSIADNDWKGLKEEIGDVLLHLIFYAKIGEEQGKFDIADAIHAECEKLIFRHPHIYGDVKVENEEDVKRNWEQLKLKEGKKSVLAGVPRALPAIIKSFRMQEKAAKVGFDWETKEQVWDKVQEEIGELQEAVDSKSLDKMEDEFGDVLFSLVNYARFIGVDPESALERTNKKFKKRFEYVENQSSKPLQEMTLVEMDALWNEAKKI
jgi:XTP/dITP diphosphohydrolase